MRLKPLTEEEKAVRLRVLGEARRAEEEARQRANENARRAAEDNARRRAEEEAAERRKAEEEARRRTEEEARRKAEELAAKLLAEEGRKQRDGGGGGSVGDARAAAPTATVRSIGNDGATARPAAEARTGEAGRRPPLAGKAAPQREAEAEDEARRRASRGGVVPAKRPATRARPQNETGPKRIDQRALGEGGEIEERRGPSLAALRRQRERERRQMSGAAEAVVREVVLPETITVQELAARMAVRGAEVVKVLMKNGILATINQMLDADTAELVISSSATG
jgi:translation initiation factor IF-2